MRDKFTISRAQGTYGFGAVYAQARLDGLQTFVNWAAVFGIMMISAYTGSSCNSDAKSVDGMPRANLSAIDYRTIMRYSDK